LCSVRLTHTKNTIYRWAKDRANDIIRARRAGWVPIIRAEGS